MNFKIKNLGPVSESFLSHGVKDFQEAILYIRHLPYKRNKNIVDITCVLDEHCGTCSTKHATLSNLAIENGIYSVKLILVMMKMNGENTPKIRKLLEKYKLDYIPEAHTYLKVGKEIIDCTFPGNSANNIKADIIKEIEIEPYQITDFKVQYHKDFLINWLTQNPEIKYDIDKLWKIREECISELSK